MNSEKFLKKLNKALGALKPVERARTVQYYREILQDRMEEGISEEEAVAGMEPIETIAERILAENGCARTQRSGLSTALVIMGSPLWLVWVVVAAVLLVTMYAVAWTVIISLFAVVAALGAGLVAGVCGMVIYWMAYPMTGLFLLGCGLVCAALGIALFFPTLWLSKILIAGTAKAGKAAWRKLFSRKDGAEA